MDARRLRVYEEPEPGACYCIGADVASGAPGGHFSAFHVLFRPREPDEDGLIRLRQAAVYHRRIATDQYGTDLDTAGRYYNFAWIGIENNAGWGDAVAKTLWKENRYPRVFWERSATRERSKPRDRIGWNTNFHSRQFIVAQLGELVGRGMLVLNDRDTVEELFNFREDEETHRVQAMPGKYDDLVLSLAIAVQMHRLQPMSSGDPREKRKQREQHIWHHSQMTDKEFIEQSCEKERKITLLMARRGISRPEAEELAQSSARRN
jgi:hypothetical protein